MRLIGDGAARRSQLDRVRAGEPGEEYLVLQPSETADAVHRDAGGRHATRSSGTASTRRDDGGGRQGDGRARRERRLHGPVHRGRPGVLTLTRTGR